MGEAVPLPRPPAGLANVGVRRARDNRGAARWALAATQSFGRQRRPERGCASPLAASSLPSQLRREARASAHWQPHWGPCCSLRSGASSSWERAVPSVIVGGAAELPRTVPPPMALAFTAVFITAGGFLMAAVAPAIGVTRVSCGPWPPWQRTKPHVHIRGRLDHTPRGLATPPLAPPTADVAFGRFCVLTSGKHARSRSGRRLPHAPHARRRSDCSSVQRWHAHDMFAVCAAAALCSITTRSNSRSQKSDHGGK